MAEEHPIRVVARRTGLSAHVIRAWEKRYGAVHPRRTSTNRRVYSTEDIERLGLLRQATLAGRSIGQIAKLSLAELRALVTEDETAARGVELPTGFESRPSRMSAEKFLEASFRAAERMDAPGLTTVLNRASVSLTRPTLMREVIVPLMQRIGDAWRNGDVRVSHEHLASAVVRSFLGAMNGAFELSAIAPELVITTPSGQLHELGALLVAATASADGWRVTYLGPNLPAEDIAAAVRQNRARAIALSIVYPGDDPHVRTELTRLRQLVGRHVAILVGGRCADSYRDVFEATAIQYVPDLTTLHDDLEHLRHSS